MGQRDGRQHAELLQGRRRRATTTRATSPAQHRAADGDGPRCHGHGVPMDRHSPPTATTTADSRRGQDDDVLAAQHAQHSTAQHTAQHRTARSQRRCSAGNNNSSNSGSNDAALLLLKTRREPSQQQKRRPMLQSTHKRIRQGGSRAHLRNVQGPRRRCGHAHCLAQPTGSRQDALCTAGSTRPTSCFPKQANGVPSST